MINKLFFLGIVFSLTVTVSSVSFGQQGGKSMFENSYAADQLELKKDWDNFRERDATVFRFKFVMPESYVAGYKKERDSQFLSGVRNQVDLSYFAKYSVFKITEEILSEKTGRKIIVADPDLALSKFGIGPSSSQLTHGDKQGFDNFPYWTKKNFLKYDQSVGNIIEINVELSEHFIKPVCTIHITVFDSNGKKIHKYKYKKKFKQIKKKTSKSKYHSHLTNSVWEKETFSGIPIPTIIDIYVQTLEEMLTEQNFTF